MRTKLIEAFPDGVFLLADGFDDAILGVHEDSMRVIYSVSKCIHILEQQGMTTEEAEEYFLFNTYSAYVGEKTPIWCTDF